MITQCPHCSCLNVRHSSIHGAEVSVRHIFLAAYRCRDCRKRFWIFKTSGYHLVGILGVAIMVVIISWNMANGLEGRHGEAGRGTVAAEGSADRITLAAGRFADTAKLKFLQPLSELILRDRDLA